MFLIKNYYIFFKIILVLIIFVTLTGFAIFQTHSANLHIEEPLEKQEYLGLTKAIVTLLYAKRFYREAQEDFSMGDQETFMPLSKSIKILDESKKSYFAALDAFIKSCS